MARISSRLAERSKTDKESAFRTARFRSDAARAFYADFFRDDPRSKRGCRGGSHDTGTETLPMDWKDRLADFERRNPGDASGQRVSQQEGNDSARLALEMLEKYGPYWDQPDKHHLDPRTAWPMQMWKNSQIRQKRMDDLLWYYFKQDKAALGPAYYSEVRAALDAMVCAASGRALQPNGDLNEALFDDLTRKAAEFIHGLHHSLRWANNGKEGLRLWHHRALEPDRLPGFDRPNIEAAVEAYLKLPYSAPKIDRLLVDLLIAVELSAFVSGIKEKYESLSWFSRWPLYRQTKILADQMSRCYSVIGSDGQVSARYLRELLIRLAEKGAVWPPPIYPLIDDIIARGGQL
jgi:hypothetical protein